MVVDEVAAVIARCGSIGVGHRTSAAAVASTGRPGIVLAAVDVEAAVEWVDSTGVNRRSRIAIIATTASRRCSRTNRSASNSRHIRDRDGASRRRSSVEIRETVAPTRENDAARPVAVT